MVKERSGLPLDLPVQYNAAEYFIDRHLDAGRRQRVVFTDQSGPWTCAQLSDRVDRVGNALLELGVAAEQRVLMCMLDSIDFPAVFFGAIKIGAIPVPVNTMLVEDDYQHMLNDSQAAVLVVSDTLYSRFAEWLGNQPHLRHVVIAGRGADGHSTLSGLMREASPVLDCAPTRADDPAFWLYTSGSTGKSKGAVHRQSDLFQTCQLYASGVLGLNEDDVIFSAAKLFFAYGLGNAMSFPLHAGCRTVLLADRPTPDVVLDTMKEHEVSVFFGVPTLYAAILAGTANDRHRVSDRLRLCISAGEALPEDIARTWEERFGVPILDGLGSTEMLHIFLSNRPGDICYGSTGTAVPGYSLKVLGDDGAEVEDDEIGELVVSGPSSATCYWGQKEKSALTFQGPWTHTGDKYYRDPAGYFHYCGRSDDMLKVGGIWVSPFEVENALIGEERVLEVAVIGREDDRGLVKPKAYVVLKEGVEESDHLARELQVFVKDRLAPYKYPRWIDFVSELPKTSTGKIQRFKLRSDDSVEDRIDISQ